MNLIIFCSAASGMAVNSGARTGFSILFLEGGDFFKELSVKLTQFNTFMVLKSKKKTLIWADIYNKSKKC